MRSCGTMCAMRPLRNFKTNQCCLEISKKENGNAELDGQSQGTLDDASGFGGSGRGGGMRLRRG